jgi:hypothetical protein
MAFQVQAQKAKIVPLLKDKILQYVKILYNTVQILAGYPIAHLL